MARTGERQRTRPSSLASTPTPSTRGPARSPARACSLTLTLTPTLTPTLNPNPSVTVTLTVTENLTLTLTLTLTLILTLTTLVFDQHATCSIWGVIYLLEIVSAVSLALLPASAAPELTELFVAISPYYFLACVSQGVCVGASQREPE